MAMKPKAMFDKGIVVTLRGHLEGYYEMVKGKPLPDPPESWIKVGVCGHDIGNNYNPSTMTIYKTKQGKLMYEIYRDGCFYPFYGNLYKREL